MCVPMYMYAQVNPKGFTFAQSENVKSLRINDFQVLSRHSDSATSTFATLWVATVPKRKIRGRVGIVVGIPYIYYARFFEIRFS